MTEVEDEVEIKFRLSDGSDIGPKTFSSSTTVSTLKETIISEWPKGNDSGPRTAMEVKLISGGRILDNNTTAGECTIVPLSDIITTMHVVIQPSLPDNKKQNQNNCCSIL